MPCLLSRWFLVIGFLWTLFPVTAWARDSDKLPPPSVAQINIRFNIQQGTGLYESSGSVICSPDPQSNKYTLHSLSPNIVNEEGTYLYARTSSRTARLVATSGVTATVDLTFETAISGRFELNSTLGAQSGTFQIFPKLGETATLAPSTGRQLALVCKVAGATGTFAPQGTFVLSTSADGSGYSIRGDRTNVRDSAGQLSYAPVGAANAVFSLTDGGGTSTLEAKFSRANAGSFQIQSPLGAQNGTFEVIFAPSFKPTFISRSPGRALWENESFSLEAVVLSSEPHTSRWYREGSPDPVSTTPVLEFRGLKPGDSGRYRFEAVSPVGSASFGAIMEVKPARDHEYTWARPVPLNANLYAVHAAADGRRLFTVGTRGAIAGSPDGTSWTGFRSPTTNVLLAAASNATAIVFAGYNGTILTSADGRTWSRAAVATGADLRGASFGNGTFVAVGDNGTILTSADGRAWAARESGTREDLHAVSFTPAGFIAVGDSGTVLLSSDGTTWSAMQRATDVTLRAISAQPGLIVAVGDLGAVISSPDGRAWTRRSSGVSESLYGILAAGGTFHAVGRSGTYLTSTNAVSWTPATIGVRAEEDINAITALGSTLVIVTHYGSVWTKQGTGAWVDRTDSIGFRSSVAYGRDTFVAVGSGQDRTSYDGVNWSTNNATNSAVNWQSILFTGSRFLSVGERGNARYSDNGVTWTAGRTSTTNTLNELAAGNNLIVAVGSAGTVITSPDGAVWTTRVAQTTQTLRAVTFGRGRFVAAGSTGTVLTSSDGISWFPAATSLSASDEPRSVFFDARTGRFILVGLNGLAMLSEDGLTWRRIDPGTEFSLYHVDRLGDRLCAVGDGGTVLYSADGVTWTMEVPLSIRTLSGSAFGAGVSVLVGNFGNILRAGAIEVAPPKITAQPVAVTSPAGSAVTLTVGASGTPAVSYQWFRNGTSIAGATTPVLQLSNLQTASAGDYFVQVTNVLGNTGSSTARVLLGTSTNTSRLKNVSVRTLAGEGDDSLILGFFVRGNPATERLNLLLRAIGPTLAGFGVGGTMRDPLLRAYQGSRLVAENDDWGVPLILPGNNTQASLEAAARQVGAFALRAGSLDAALQFPFNAGGYSAQLVPLTGRGVAMIEAYDADSRGDAAFPRLINMSTRARSGTGENVLILGFVISGNGPKTLLIRGIGPTLGSFGVSDVLTDPLLRVFSGTSLLMENDDWRGWSTMADLHARVGAFPLAANSADASLAITLSPGAYTIHILGKGTTSGVALAELYEVP
jgi:hypothetical protein